MLSRRRNRLAVACSCATLFLLVCCQKVDLTGEPEDTGTDAGQIPSANVVGTGAGTMEFPFTVEDVRAASLSEADTVWVIGYMVGTAPRSMNNALFRADAGNQSNILLSSDSLCEDTSRCIPVELSDKYRKAFSLPANPSRFRKCLLVRGVPSKYLYRKGLRNICTGLWMNDFDLSSVTAYGWGSIVL